MVIELQSLKDMLETRQCSQPGCSENQVELWVSAIKGMQTHMQAECVKCGHVTSMKSTKSENFNAAWWTSVLGNGIPLTHFNRFLLNMNFSGVSKSC